jgi:hypothetical protein
MKPNNHKQGTLHTQKIVSTQELLTNSIKWYREQELMYEIGNADYHNGI